MTQWGVDAVVFDWGGTLTPWHALDPRAAWATAVSDEELADRLWQAEIEMWVRSRDEHRSATIDEVFVRVGVTPTPVMLDAISRWWEPHTFLDPDAPLLFDGLRERGIKIGVLSNTLWTRAEHERIFARDGVLGMFDGAVYTSEIPWTKPHPEAFRAALDSIGVDDPASAVFVGDRPFDDIHGAKSAGMRAVLIPHSDIPADQEGPVRGEADAIIQRLGDLIDVVDAWSGRAPGR